MQTFLLKLGVFLLRKVNFRQWAILEDKKYSCIQAVEDSDPNFSQLLVDYLSTALYFNVDFSKIGWKDTIESFYKIHAVTSNIRKIPLTSRRSEGKDKKDAWDYSGRLWYFYSDAIATAYGWSIKEIAKLKVDDALAYIQEIFTNQYLDREFVWSTTEIAYSYNDKTKKSKYTPLPKPYWMTSEPSEVGKRKPPPIPKSLLPVGNVISVLDQRNETKKT